VEIASQTSRSVILHLGDGNTSSGGIHIGNGNGSSNNVNILNGDYTSGQTAGTVNILTGTHGVGTLQGNMNLFTTSRGTLTIGGANNAAITFNKSSSFTSGLTSNTISSTGGTNTIYSDPGPTQTYNTSVCSNNLSCSFGSSAGSCNLGGSSASLNIGFNMPSASGASISIGTAGVQDTNVLIATKGATVTGTNKIQIGASANALSVASGTITLGTADTALSIGANSLQSSNIVIGTKGALITGSNKIVIGASANALSLSSGTININSPLTPINTYPVTTGCIGEKIAGTVLLTIPLAANANTNIASIPLPNGVWMITAHQTNDNLVSFFQLLISDVSVARQYTIAESAIFGTTSTNLTSLNVSGTVTHNNVAPTTTYYAVSRCNTIATLTNIFMYAFRIA
jgi:hypothetical protein